MRSETFDKGTDAIRCVMNLLQTRRYEPRRQAPTTAACRVPTTGSKNLSNICLCTNSSPAGVPCSRHRLSGLEHGPRAVLRSWVKLFAQTLAAGDRSLGKACALISGQVTSPLTQFSRLECLTRKGHKDAVSMDKAVGDMQAYV